MNNIGIVGGVGPLAGVDLHKKIIKNTNAHSDQEHLPVYHISCGHLITDRTEYYLNQTLKNPAIAIFNVITQLHQMQCSIIGIPCNSAHIPCIRDALDNVIQLSYSNDIEVLHLIKEVGLHIKSEGIEKVGLLATKGTIQSKLYQETLDKMGIQVVVPTTDERINRVHDSIYHAEYGIKAKSLVTDRAREILLEETEHLIHEGVESVVLGCTELPLALTEDMVRIPLLDATDVLARAMIYRSNPSKLMGAAKSD